MYGKGNAPFSSNKRDILMGIVEDEPAKADKARF